MRRVAIAVMFSLAAVSVAAQTAVTSDPLAVSLAQKSVTALTGESAINLPIEAVQSVEVLTNPYTAEYGQFTGAVTTVQTKSGSDKFHADETSFFPRPRRRSASAGRERWRSGGRRCRAGNR